MSQEKYRESVERLTELGFTALEATVYAYLIENSPATAYRIAQDIGKPVANTYKAVSELARKGAVMIDETQNRLCQAVSPKEVLGGLKETFLDRHTQAAEALSRLKPVAGGSDKIFSLTTPEQVFERCRSLIAEAVSIILLDAFPGVVETLKPWLEAAAARGVTVVLQAYQPAALNGVEVIDFQEPDRMIDRWRGNWLIVVVDGAEYLFAFLSDDGRTVRNAIWCGSAFLAVPQHSNLAHSFRASLIEQLIKNGAPSEQLQKELTRTEKWLTMRTRGYEKLIAEFSD